MRAAEVSIPIFRNGAPLHSSNRDSVEELLAKMAV
jgi:hypothetical protein